MSTVLAESKNKSLKNFTDVARNVKFQKVKLSDIHYDTRNNVRDDAAYSADNMSELKDSIRVTGMILSPIHVMPVDNIEGKKYTVMAGFRRTMILNELAEEDPKFADNVPVVITNTTSDPGVFKLVQAVENLQRHQLTPLETARTFHGMMEDEDVKLTQQEVADAAGVSRPQVTQYLKLLDFPEEIQKLLNERKIQFTHARELMRIPPGEKNQTWLQEAKGAVGMTPERFKRHLESTYHLNADRETVTNKKEDGSTQRTQLKTRKASEVYEKYQPEIKARYAAAKQKGNEPEAARLSIVLDTIAWFFCQDNAALSKELKPWEDEQAKKAEAEKQGKAALTKKQAYLTALVKSVNDKRKIDEDDEDAVRPTLADAYSAVRADIQARIDKAASDGKSIVESFGFELGDLDAFMQELTVKYKENAAAKKAAKNSKAARDAWKSAFKESRKAESAEDKAAAKKNLAAAVAGLKKLQIDPEQVEKAFLESEQKAKEAKQTKGKDKKAKATVSA